MSGERFEMDHRLQEELRALERLCAYIAVEAKVLKVPEAEELSLTVSKRVRELLSVGARH